MLEFNATKVNGPTPGMGVGSTSWVVTFTNRDKMPVKSFSTPYYMGSGHKGKPKGSDVMECLLLDACSGQMLFADFCGEFGYDEDSRKSLDTYLACQKTAIGLRGLLGYAEFAKLQEMNEDERQVAFSALINLY